MIRNSEFRRNSVNIPHRRNTEFRNTKFRKNTDFRIRRNSVKMRNSVFTVTGGHVIWLTEERQLTVKEIGIVKIRNSVMNTEFRYDTEFRKNTEFRIPRNSAKMRNSVKMRNSAIIRNSAYYGIPYFQRNSVLLRNSACYGIPYFLRNSVKYPIPYCGIPGKNSAKFRRNSVSRNSAGHSRFYPSGILFQPSMCYFRK